MFADNQRISKKQLIVSLMLSFTGVLLFAIPGIEGFESGAGIVGIVVGFLAFGMYLFCLMRVSRFLRHPEKTAGRFLGKGMALLYALIAILGAAWILQNAAYVTSAYLLNQEGVNRMVLLLLLAAALGTGTDLQSRGRLAEMVEPIVWIGFWMFLILSVFQGNVECLGQMGAFQWKTVGRTGWIIFSVLSMTGFLPFVLWNTKYHGGNGAGLFGGMGKVLFLLICSLLTLRAVLGEKGIHYKHLPMAELMAGMALPGKFLHRLDILWISLLLFSLLFAVGSLMFYAGFMMEQFRISGMRIPILVLTGVVALPKVTGDILERYFLPFLCLVMMPVMLVLTLGIWMMGRSRS